MNRLVKRIWKSTWVSDSVGVVYTDEGGRMEMFEMPNEQDDLTCRLFDISKTHKAMSYGCIPMGLLASWCSCIQVCKDMCSGGRGYDIDAELVEAIVLGNGGVVDCSNPLEKQGSSAQPNPLDNPTSNLI